MARPYSRETAGIIATPVNVLSHSSSSTTQRISLAFIRTRADHRPHSLPHLPAHRPVSSKSQDEMRNVRPSATASSRPSHAVRGSRLSAEQAMRMKPRRPQCSRRRGGMTWHGLIAAPPASFDSTGSHKRRQADPRLRGPRRRHRAYARLSSHDGMSRQRQTQRTRCACSVIASHRIASSRVRTAVSLPPRSRIFAPRSGMRAGTDPI